MNDTQSEFAKYRWMQREGIITESELAERKARLSTGIVTPSDAGYKGMLN